VPFVGEDVPSPKFVEEVPSLPAGHALELIELLDRIGCPSAPVLERAGLARKALEVPDGRLTLEQLQRLIREAIAASKQPWLGFSFGLCTRVPAHGFLGFAAMTAPTVRDALELAVRYAPIRTNIVRLRLVLGAEQSSLVIEERFDLGLARETVLSALAVGIWKIGQALTLQRLTGRVDFAFPPPAYLKQLTADARAAYDLRFSQPENAMHFSSHYLALPIAMAHTTAFRLAREQCERALSELDRAGLERRVREVLPRLGGGVCTVDEVALKLGTSTRTLQRKLKAGGLSFSELTSELRVRQACTLLRDHRLSVEQVAERTGYSDVSNFTRAFRRWTGSTPAAFRKADDGTEGGDRSR
jgi:AraC-like DNA-binding protein